MRMAFIVRAGRMPGSVFFMLSTCPNPVNEYHGKRSTRETETKDSPVSGWLRGYDTAHVVPDMESAIGWKG